MSQENVEIVRRIYGLWKRDGFGVTASLDLMDPGVEWVNPPEAVEPGIRRGHDGFARAMRGVVDSFDDLRQDPLEFIEGGGDRVVVPYRQTGAGRGSGVAFDHVLAAVWTIRDGKVIRYEWFYDRDEALEAAGLLE